jgi:hypothetical protein
MTNELIERLSNPSWSDCSCHHIMAEAAAEIERLREVAKVDSEVASELLAERGKLLAALEWIANARTAMDGGSIAENRKIAADALKGCPNA